jgi:hypothetical protein
MVSDIKNVSENVSQVFGEMLNCFDTYSGDPRSLKTGKERKNSEWTKGLKGKRFDERKING